MKYAQQFAFFCCFILSWFIRFDSILWCIVHRLSFMNIISVDALAPGGTRSPTNTTVTSAANVLILFSSNTDACFELYSSYDWVTLLKHIATEIRRVLTRYCHPRNLYVDLCVRSRYQGQGQVIIFHRYCGMQLLVPGLDTCFWHTGHHISDAPLYTQQLLRCLGSKYRTQNSMYGNRKISA